MTSIKKFLVSESTSILKTLQIVDRGEKKVALVVQGAKLIGMVTDGDIRRAIIRGVNLDQKVGDIMQTSFLSLNTGSSPDDAMNIMLKNTIQHIPVLNEKGNVTGLFFLEDLISADIVPNVAVIMAGGQGMRLRPITDNCPKPMLSVGGKPILELLVEQCVRAGIQEIFISINYLKEQVKEHFGNGSKWDVVIRYLEEPFFLGTAGALGLLPKSIDDSILVINGDILSRVSYGEVLKYHSNQKATMTVCVRQHERQVPFGVVTLKDGCVASFQEKPIERYLVSAGIYVLEGDLAKSIKKNEVLDMPELLGRALASGEVVAPFLIHEYWLDIGHKDNLQRARMDWD